MKPKKHKKRMPGQKSLTPSPSQAPEANDLRYDCLSALFDYVFRSGVVQPQVSDPNKSMYCHEFQLTFNGPDGPVPVSQARIPLTAAQIPSFSVMLKNFGPYLPDDAPLAWFKELKHPGPGQPPGTKATFRTTLFEEMLDARDTLVAARKTVTQRAVLNKMGHQASPTKKLRRWLESMGVSWTNFKQWSR